MAAYDRAAVRLLGLIGSGRSGVGSYSRKHPDALTRQTQTRKLLAEMGNPQQDYPIVHVTGTSGKGSVAAMIGAALTAAGYRVGLRTSPYVQVATEKVQIGRRLIDAFSLDRVSDRVSTMHQRLAQHVFSGHQIGYAEAWAALTLSYFSEQRVNVAIIEVGAGGRLDATNVFDPAVSVITTVGLDHTRTLGPTLADIAWHKAGVIKAGAIAVVGPVPSEAWKVIQHEARTLQAPVIRPQGRPCARGAIGMPGEFQRINAGIALAALEALGLSGFSVSDTAATAGLASARLPARLERMPTAEGPKVWIDGAHNADKIAALTHESSRFEVGGSLPVVVLGILKSKDATAIVKGIVPFASAVVATEPAVVGRAPLPASDLVSALTAHGYSGPLFEVPDPECAVLLAEDIARSRESIVVVTGSMYLAGQVRRRWYGDEDIIRQRTPWPSAGANAPSEVA